MWANNGTLPRVSHHDCVSRYVWACVRQLEREKTFQTPPSFQAELQHLFFSLHSSLLLLLSPGVFLYFLLILSLVYTVLSLPLTLLGILRRAHMHRNTSPLSSRLLVFADSLWNFSVRCLFQTHTHTLKTLISESFCA